MYQKSIDFGGEICCIDYCDAWKLVFVTTFEGKMVSLDKGTFKVLHEEAEKSGIIKCKFDENLKCFMVSTTDGQMVFHAYGKTGIVHRMKLHHGELHQFHIHNGYLLTVGEDKKLIMSDLPKLS